MAIHTIDTVTSILTQKELDLYCSTFNILADLRPKLLDRNATIKDSPVGKIGIYTHFIEFANFRIHLSKDPLPTNDVVDLPLVEVLDENHTIIRKYPELFLSVVELSRSFVDTDVQMGLLDFVKSLDPFKVKTKERTRAENEVPLLEETVDRVISPSAKTIQLFDHTIDDELKAVTRKKKRKVAFNAVSPPVKKARAGGIVISEPNLTTDGKSPAVMKKLIDHSGQGDVGSGPAVQHTEDFVSSFVTPNLELEHQDESNSVQDKLVRTQPTSARFVVLSSNSEPLDTEVQIEADTISPKVASPILNV
nr:hypothetical protein [Tanacetum cinerariifolium]